MAEPVVLRFLSDDPAPRRGWLHAAVLVVGATGVSLALDEHVSLASQAMVYLAAVALAAYRLAWAQAAGAALSAVLALNYFFVPPRYTFEVEHGDHLIALAVMLGVSLLISHLARTARRETRAAQRAEQRAHQLQQVATRLGDAHTADDVRALGFLALREAFAGPCQLVVAAAPTDAPAAVAQMPGLDAGVRDGLLQCLRDGAVLGPGTGRWPGLDAWYLPVREGESAFGAAQVGPAHPADTDGLDHARAVVAMLAQALRRLSLDQIARAVRAEADRRQVLNTFLAALSHDLRTPLATLVGAASTLREQDGRLPPDARQRLLDSLVAESARLETLAENTLHLVRLSAQGAGLPRQWESFEDIVGAAVARVRRREGGARVSARVEPGLPLVRAEPVLMDQLLANLLDNALRHGAGAVLVRAALAGGRFRLSVADQGPGIDAARRASLFQPFSQAGDGRGTGAGLGLAVCRAVAQAHGGELDLLLPAQGGCEFVLTLPVEPQPSLETPR
jgi:two-component system sensor histidine kinase KdpD